MLNNAVQNHKVLKQDRLRVPVYIWLVGFAVGALIAGGSLNYAPQGRINVLWVWLVWAGLPLLGSLVASLAALFGRNKPWLFQWRQKSFRWQPTKRQRLYMLMLLQLVWLVVGLGVLCGFWVLLLFTDLAFGWSSTLVQEPALAHQTAQWLAAPWQPLWPEAVPTFETVAATHYQRISPGATDAVLAGSWWRFLMASLIVYNLLPRGALALGLYVRWRAMQRPELQVRTSAALADQNPPQQPPLQREQRADWQAAERLAWELDDGTAAAQLGLRTWAEDEQQLEQVLERKPGAILWQVKASRSPVAELSDLVERARAAGVKRQALWPQVDPATDPDRHLASWRAFAAQHQLVWLDDGRADERAG